MRNIQRTMKWYLHPLPSSGTTTKVSPMWKYGMVLKPKSWLITSKSLDRVLYPDYGRDFFIGKEKKNRYSCKKNDMKKLLIGVYILVSMYTSIAQTKIDFCTDTLKGQRYSFLISQVENDSLVVYVHRDLSKTIVNYTAVDFTTGDSLTPVLPTDMCMHIPWHKMASIVYQHRDDNHKKDYILYLEVGVFGEPQCGLITYHGKRYAIRCNYTIIEWLPIHICVGIFNPKNLYLPHKINHWNHRF